MDSAYREWATRIRVPLGFAFGIAYLVFSQPNLWFLISGGLVALLGLALRGWAAGHLEKNQTLAREGPYAYTRNPLYFGSLLIGAGFVVAGRSWLLAALFVSLFVLVYWPVMKREETLLRRQFGESYDRYASEVPLLIPFLKGRQKQLGVKFRWAQYKKNREYEAAAGYAAVVIFLILKMKLR